MVRHLLPLSLPLQLHQRSPFVRGIIPNAGFGIAVPIHIAVLTVNNNQISLSSEGLLIVSPNR